MDQKDGIIPAVKLKHDSTKNYYENLLHKIWKFTIPLFCLHFLLNRTYLSNDNLSQEIRYTSPNEKHIDHSSINFDRNKKEYKQTSLINYSFNKDGLSPCTSAGVSFTLPYVCASGKTLAGIFTSYPSFDFDQIEATAYAIALAEIKVKATIPTTIGRLSLLKWLVGVMAFGSSIPSEIGLLVDLNVMIFPNNRQLLGTIPSQVGLLTKLSILVYSTLGVSGQIPSEIANLPLLAYWDSGGTPFSSTVPSQIGQLTLMTTFFAGQSSINFTNFDFSQLSLISALDLSQNRINIIPSSIFTLTQLTHLDLGFCSISATLPQKLFEFPELVDLKIAVNQIYGTIPSQIAKLQNLQLLELGLNDLTGKIPSEMGLMTELLIVSMRNNSIGGAIPKQFRSLSRLNTFHMSHNYLTDSIPTEFGSLLQLTDLELDYNQLEGTFPPIFSLPLRILYLNSNRIEGSIPSEIGLMSLLTELQLGSNFFSGNIPTQISLIKALHYLDISHNNFTGTIPPLPSSISLFCDYSGIVGDSRCAYYVKDQGDYLEDSVFAIAVSFSAAISLIIILTILLFIWKRRHMAIVVSGLAFNLLTLIGLLCIVISVIPFGLTMSNSVSVRDTECKVTPILFVFGTIMVFSTISARNYPIWKMFDPTSTEKMVLPKIDVIRPVGVVVIAAVTVISIYAYENKGAYLNSGCRYDGSNQEILLTIIGALGILTSLFASYSSFAVRDVPVDYSDAKQVMIATFNILTFGAALTTLGLTSDTAASKFLSVSFSAILGVITFFVLVHGTKIKTILTDHTELGPTKNKFLSI